MDQSIKLALRTPEIGIPIILLILVLAAHTFVWLRSVAEGVTPIVPSLRVFAADIAIVLMVVLTFVLSKAMSLFVPEEGTQVLGIDVAPIYALVGPAVWFVPGLVLAGWLVKRKAEAIAVSIRPPAVTTTTVTGVGLVPDASSTVVSTTTDTK